jgi:hypothetical protein
METLLSPLQSPGLNRSLRVVRQELERAERNLRDAAVWTGNAGAGDRLRGIAMKVAYAARPL